MIVAAKKIGDRYRCSVLLKGGHNLNDASDLFYREGVVRWFEGKRIENPNTHGPGCTLSSAIASNPVSYTHLSGICGRKITDIRQSAERFPKSRCRNWRKAYTEMCIRDSFCRKIDKETTANGFRSSAENTSGKY